MAITKQPVKSKSSFLAILAKTTTRLGNIWLAGVLSVLSVVLTKVQQTQSRPFTYPTVIVGVVVATIYGGYKTGLLCLALASAGLIYFVIPPVYGWGTSEIESVRFAFFWFAALFLIFFIDRTTRAEQKLRIALIAEEAARLKAEQTLGGQLIHETVLREEKARRDAIFESALDAIVVMDIEGIVVEWNSASERVFGWTKEEAIGQRLSELIIPQPQRHWHDLGLKEHTITGKETVINRRREMVGVRKDGTSVSIELVVTPVDANGGMFTGYMRDITARKKIEEERENLLTNERRMRATAENMARQIEIANREEVRLRAEAEQANRSKSDFLAMMSHELRTPLNAIGGYTQLLDMGLHGPVTGPQKGALSRINLNQARLLSIINEILDYAKLEAGQMSIAMETVSLSDVAAAVEVSILPMATQKGIELVDELVTGGHDIMVRADPGKLQQILLNLLSNSVKFTGPGGRVRLTCEVSNKRVSIRVNDTGIGIPADKINSIFEPFVQVHGGKTEYARQDGTGTGLGLAISRDLARAMGGDITVQSEEGVGSSFCVELPLARE